MCLSLPAAPTASSHPPTHSSIVRCVCAPPCKQTRYIRSSREIKRLDSLALSPIFGWFGESLAGEAGRRPRRPARTGCHDCCSRLHAGLHRSSLALTHHCALPPLATAPRRRPVHCARVPPAGRLRAAQRAAAGRLQPRVLARPGQFAGALAGLQAGSRGAAAACRRSVPPQGPRKAAVPPPITIPNCRTDPSSPTHAQCINRWLSVRLELLGISVVFGTAVLVAVAAPRSAGLAGLALTSALNLTGAWVGRGLRLGSWPERTCEQEAGQGWELSSAARPRTRSVAHPPLPTHPPFLPAGLMNWMVRQTTELEVRPGVGAGSGAGAGAENLLVLGPCSNTRRDACPQPEPTFSC